MQSHTDKYLKAVISLLRELAEGGTMEQGQKEAITRAISMLRRAARSHDPAKMQVAIGQAAKIFLRQHAR